MENGKPFTIAGPADFHAPELSVYSKMFCVPKTNRSPGAGALIFELVSTPSPALMETITRRPESPKFGVGAGRSGSWRHVLPSSALAETLLSTTQ